METVKDKIDNMIKNKLSASIVLVNGRKITTNPRFVFDPRALEQGFLRWSYNNRSDEVKLEYVKDIVFQELKI